ncbi:MAG TPA: hypothetical protein VK897_22835 [Anaerolineales bacterium]|nr:hypothetical protein [Anaerolineales bacterium]
MFNDHLSTEEAKMKIQERDREAETYRYHKQLGYSEYGLARWILMFIMLVTLMLILLF